MSTKRAFSMLLSCLPLVLLLGCGDDSGGESDGPAKLDQGPGVDLVVDAPSGTPDEGTATPDQGTTTPDQGTASPDAAPTATILTSSHKGWQAKDCSNCHNLPVKGHTTSDSSECASCHGGNGACDPNGANSNKKNHTASLGCTSGCHGSSKHGFNNKTECISCHLASAGTIDCQ